MSFKWTLDIDWTINIIVVVHENPKYIHNFSTKMLSRNVKPSE